MKTVDAQIEIEVTFTCPHCEEYLNLFDDEEFPGLNDDGRLSMSLFGESFGCKDFDEEVTCPECHEKFCIANVWW